MDRWTLTIIILFLKFQDCQENGKDLEGKLNCVDVGDTM